MPHAAATRGVKTSGICNVVDSTDDQLLIVGGGGVGFKNGENGGNAGEFIESNRTLASGTFNVIVGQGEYSDIQACW